MARAPAFASWVGAEFPGGTYERLFYVADVSASGPIINGELNASILADSDFLAVFPMRGEGHGRFIGVDGSETRRRRDRPSNGAT